MPACDHHNASLRPPQCQLAIITMPDANQMRLMSSCVQPYRSSSPQQSSSSASQAPALLPRGPIGLGCSYSSSSRHPDQKVRGSDRPIASGYLPGSQSSSQPGYSPALRTGQPASQRKGQRQQQHQQFDRNRNRARSNRCPCSCWQAVRPRPLPSVAAATAVKSGK